MSPYDRLVCVQASLLFQTISTLFCRKIYSTPLRVNEDFARYAYFFWFVSGDTQLSTDVRDAIRDLSNEVYLSAASVWEAIIKYQLGKLPLPKHPETYLPNSAIAIKLSVLPRDPFDRMLICQALQNRPLARGTRSLPTWASMRFSCRRRSTR